MWVWLGLDAFPGSPAPGASSPQASQLQSPPSLTGFPTFLGPVGGICTSLLSVTRSFPTWLHAWPLGTLPPTLLEGCLGQGCVKALPGKSPDGARTSLHKLLVGRQLHPAHSRWGRGLLPDSSQTCVSPISTPTCCSTHTHTHTPAPASAPSLAPSPAPSPILFPIPPTTALTKMTAATAPASLSTSGMTSTEGERAMRWSRGASEAQRY